MIGKIRQYGVGLSLLGVGPPLVMDFSRGVNRDVLRGRDDSASDAVIDQQHNFY